jgi:hypothetical protein
VKGVKVERPSTLGCVKAEGGQPDDVLVADRGALGAQPHEGCAPWVVFQSTTAVSTNPKARSWSSCPLPFPIALARLALLAVADPTRQPVPALLQVEVRGRLPAKGGESGESALLYSGQSGRDFERARAVAAPGHPFTGAGTIGLDCLVGL